MITNDRASAEALQRDDPVHYAELHGEGYIRGVPAGQPAVVSINGMFASMAVNEFLARLHGFREDNATCAAQRFALHGPFYVPEPEGAPCEILSQHVGRGDVNPMLDMPSLSVAR